MPKKTFAAVKEAKGELIAQIKDNQKKLHRETARACDYIQPISSYDAPIEKGRNRIEKRKSEVFEVRNCLMKSRDWNNYIDCVIRVTRYTEILDTKEKKWKVRGEIAYYASSHRHDADYFERCIREHWGTENRHHYVKDVSMGEDASRIRVNAGIFARLRSFALNILRFNKVENIKGALFENALNFTRILSMKGLLR